MRKRRRWYGSMGCLTVTAGVVIVLALILPSGFWWFALALALICCGVWLMRCP